MQSRGIPFQYQSVLSSSYKRRPPGQPNDSYASIMIFFLYHIGGIYLRLLTPLVNSFPPSYYNHSAALSHLYRSASDQLSGMCYTHTIYITFSSNMMSLKPVYFDSYWQAEHTHTRLVSPISPKHLLWKCSPHPQHYDP